MSRSPWKTWVVTALVLALLIVGSISYLGWRQSVPGVQAKLEVPLTHIGIRTPFILDLAAARGGVAAVQIMVAQWPTKATLFEKTFDRPRASQQRLEIIAEGKTLGLREGAATLAVYARDGFWRPLRIDTRPALTQPVTLDLTPPTLELLSSTQYLAQGGAGAVVFRSRGAARVGVNAGGIFFPAFQVGDPESGTYVALVAIPYDFPPTAPLLVAATDEAGNAASRSLQSQIRPRRFPSGKVEITEEFLRRKLPELLPDRPAIADDRLLEAFLEINRDKRRQAEETKRRLAAQTQGTPLWQGAFLQPRNTKVFSNYAETRAYRFRGQDVDRQVHFGYDLASVKESPAPAANSGVVVFAGPLTIYGNTVVIDHGMGLQTLYAHLSRIDVKMGERLERGQPLGRTGSSGLAIGDHLHYEVLVHGISVTPLEWWDAKWIRDHIGKPLREANVALFPGEEPKGEAASGR